MLLQLHSCSYFLVSAMMAKECVNEGLAKHNFGGRVVEDLESRGYKNDKRALRPLVKYRSSQIVL